MLGELIEAILEGSEGHGKAWLICLGLLAVGLAVWWYYGWNLF